MRLSQIGIVLSLALSACGSGGGDENLGAVSGNTLNQAQIDAALGPADQQQLSINETAPANAGTGGERNGNEAGLLRRHSAGNASE